MNKPKAIGTRGESAVVKACRTRGFPGAERVALHGSYDQGDVRLTTGLTAGILLEIKSGQAARTASDNQIIAWLEETEVERVNAGAAYGFLVTARAGVGPANAHKWWTHIPVGTFLDILDAPQIIGPGPGVIRMTLDTLLGILTATGWGDPQ